MLLIMMNRGINFVILICPSIAIPIVVAKALQSSSVFICSWVLNGNYNYYHIFLPSSLREKSAQWLTSSASLPRTLQYPSLKSICISSKLSVIIRTSISLSSVVWKERTLTFREDCYADSMQLIFKIFSLRGLC